jgi:hypothetical protein
MTVEWNDSEPTFPDFLPPLPPKREITYAEAAERIERVLEAAGVKLKLGFSNYDYWLDMDAEFPDGARFVGVGAFSIEARGYTRR